MSTPAALDLFGLLVLACFASGVIAVYRLACALGRAITRTRTARRQPQAHALAVVNGESW